jgi:hypothetical protein
MKTIQLTFLIILISCSIMLNEPPDFTTKNGVSFWLDGVNFNQDQVENLEDWWLDNVHLTGYTNQAARQAMEQVKVTVVPEPYDCKVWTCSDENNNSCQNSTQNCVCDYQDRICSGEINDTGHMILVAFGCPYATAYIHEHAHYLQSRYGVYDYDHQVDIVWSIADNDPFSCSEEED